MIQDTLFQLFIDKYKLYQFLLLKEKTTPIFEGTFLIIYKIHHS